MWVAIVTCPGGGCGLGWGWSGPLALCVLMLRAGSLLIWRSRVRASVRRSLLGSRRMVLWSSPGRASLGSRLCGRSCILVGGSVRRIGWSLFPLGCDRDRPNLTLRVQSVPLLWSVLGIIPLPGGGVGLVVAGAFSSVIPVKRLPRTYFAGRGIPRHLPFMAACFGLGRLGRCVPVGAS